MIGIVTYNPDMARFKKNIIALLDQAKKIVIVDNHSDNCKGIEKICSAHDIILIKNQDNYGIAKALNQICEYAQKENFSWCLLLDQDSICSDNLMETMRTYIDASDRDDIAILTPYILDEYKMTLSEYCELKLPNEQECLWSITSGSYVNIKIWHQLGGFMEELFIDDVDTEYSYNVIIHNYKIVRLNKCYILHEQGKNTEKTHLYRMHRDLTGKLTIKPAYRFNYSGIRWYYMARNWIIVTHKYKDYNGILKPIVKNMIIILSRLILEKDKITYIKYTNRGICDGLKFISKR